MAVVALRVTLDSVDPALAAAGRVALPLQQNTAPSIIFRSQNPGQRLSNRYPRGRPANL